MREIKGVKGINKKNIRSKKNIDNIINRKLFKGIGVFSILIFIVLISIYGYIFMQVEKWENKIYPNIRIYDINLDKLNKEEAIELLDEKYSNLINEKVISFKFEDKNYDISYKDLKVNYNKEHMVNEALSYGKDKSLVEKYKLIKSNYEIIINPEFSFNKDVEEEFLSQIEKDINVDKKEGTISVSNENIKITKDVTGRKVDYQDLKFKLESEINGDISSEVIKVFEIPVLKEDAKLKQVDLVKVNGKISEYKSYFYNNQDGRIANMKIASQTINGKLLMPGEIFSYNELIGETTPEKGYKLANTYLGNKIVPDYGGGICQVSTALYRAVIQANIRSLERRNHSMTVSYSEPSLDATVSYGLIDYKFENTYDSPIYIEAYVLNDNVTINIYGNVNEKGNRKYELVSEIHKSYDFEVEYEEDNTINIGDEVVIKNGMKGYESSSYLITYENGVEVNREKISTDVYAKSNRVIKKGTKKII